MARRVGSASAANIVLSSSSVATCVAFVRESSS
jgi:hypothetical protein